jgi:hypothetical protein
MTTLHGGSSEDVRTIDRPERQYNADCGGKSKTGKPSQLLVFFQIG